MMMVSFMGFSELLCLFLLNCQAIFLFASSPTQSCHQNELAALLQFKQEFYSNDSLSNGSILSSMASWEADRNCCLWNGVKCDEVSDHVIGLDLSSNQLYGTIHPNCSLFMLDHIQELNLAFNDFIWPNVSFDFTHLRSLTHLNLSGSVWSGRIPSEISHLSKLVSLDLSQNHVIYRQNAFENLIQNLTDIREFIFDGVDMHKIALRSLMNLSFSITLLSLSACDLLGELPISIFSLPKLAILDASVNLGLLVQFPKPNNTSPLQWLDFSYARFPEALPYSTHILDSISNLKSLTHLNLAFVKASIPSKLPASIGNLKSLTYINFARLKLSGDIPNAFGNLTSLMHLNLFFCNLSGVIPLSLMNLMHVTKLDLSHNNLVGQVPDFFTNMENLTMLFLNDNNFSGNIPSSVFSLIKLEIFDMSNNQLSGPLPSEVSGLSSLTGLSLNSNYLNGTIPFWVFALPSLNYLNLEENQFGGHMSEFRSFSLVDIDISLNKLEGPLPNSISKLINLTRLLLASNNFSGNLELDTFSKLQDLGTVDLSSNNLTLTSSSNISFSLPSLRTFDMSFCRITELPDFRAFSNLNSLDLSNNEIHSPVHSWPLHLPNESLLYLDLSHNLLTQVHQLPLPSLIYLNLQSNLIESPSPVLPHKLVYVIISDNKLTGEMSSTICNMSSFPVIFDFSRNELGGMIPPCLGSSSSLSVLDLQQNHFFGTIPDTFAQGNAIRVLGMSGNQLTGPIPRSLANCSNLEVLDLGRNKLIDEFPYWLESLQWLQVLVLRSNRLYGSIVSLNRTTISFPKLQVIDLSSNHFTGSLPSKCFETWYALMKVDGNSTQHPQNVQQEYFNLSVILTIKSSEIEIQSELSIFTAIDLSSNNFQGLIPESIGKLKLIRGLNFSHNNFTGEIPPSIGDLVNLEWLDLSANTIRGCIPKQLASLLFLAVLNLSQNQLEGPIPQGNQLSTFSNDSYIGNVGLCGFPLSKTCRSDQTEDHFPPSSEKDGDDIGGDPFLKALLMGYGCGTMFGFVLGLLIFEFGRPGWLLRKLHYGGRRNTTRLRRTPQRR